MKLSTRQKGKTPPSLIDYLLSVEKMQIREGEPLGMCQVEEVQKNVKTSQGKFSEEASIWLDEGENYQKMQVMNFGIFQPFEDAQEEENKLFESLRKNKIQQILVRSIITVPLGEQEKPAIPEIQTRREKLMAEYPDFFRNSLFSDPPVRGPYGYATIELKADAVPQRQKAFTLHGERADAYKKKSFRIDGIKGSLNL